jgi:hypothetical protein
MSGFVPCDATIFGMPNVYHLCASDFRGTTLLPLNALRDTYPDVYVRERVKYDGRESVMTYRVPHLDVAWADTVNLAALDPARLAAARRRLGVGYSKLLERRVVRIPVERLAGRRCVVYDSATHWINSAPGRDVPLVPPAGEFTPFDPTDYHELSEVPQRHLDYLVEQRDRGQNALGFVFVRHILVDGPIDIAGLQHTPI